jgi:Na+-driven multidrug efflux pump
MLRISLPVSFQYLFILFGFLLFLAIIGTIGTREQAASQAVITTILMGFLPTQAFGIAASVLVGQNLGTGNKAMAERYGFESARLGFYLMASIGLILFIIPDQVLYIITDKQAIIETARIPLRIVGASQAFYAIGIVLATALQGAGATVFVMFADIVCNWLIFLPLAYLFSVVLAGGIVGAWLSLPFYLVLYALLMVWRFKHGSWKHVKV